MADPQIIFILSIKASYVLRKTLKKGIHKLTYLEPVKAADMNGIIEMLFLNLSQLYWDKFTPDT